MRRSLPWLVLALTAVNAGCWPQYLPVPETMSADERHGWPKDWPASIGRRVTLEGEAMNAQLGAILQGESHSIWIDGLDKWPEGYYSGGDCGKRVRVTGTVIVRDDVPAFIPQPGEPVQSGVPVTDEEKLRLARRRFLLKESQWEVLE